MRVDVTLLDAASLARHQEELSVILHACVHDGASVGFILPHPIEEARAFWANKIASSVAAGTRLLFLASIDGAAAGTVQLNLDTMPNQPHRADVSKLLVHPNFRRLGVARTLMHALEGRAIAAKRWLLTLDTAGDPAERLYESLGYQTAGRIPAYARDALVERFDPTVVMFKLLR